MSSYSSNTLKMLNGRPSKRDVKFIKRKDYGLTFKVVPRRHAFVVFNVYQGCTIAMVKSYIVVKDVNVLDVKR